MIRAYRENAERNAMPLRMHAPVSMPSAAFDDKRLVDLFHHYAGPAGGRGRGDDILRVERINLGGHADVPQAAVGGNALEMHWALLATGRFLAVLPQSVLRFSIQRPTIISCRRSWRPSPGRLEL